MKQITILTDDRPGVLAEICEALAAENINLESIDAETHMNHGVIIITVDKYDAALRVLRNASFQAVSEESILIKLEDKPGALAQIAKRFKDANINLKSLRILKRDGANSIVALTPDNFKEAAKLVKDVHIRSLK
jgi:hypothetical protein